MRKNLVLRGFAGAALLTAPAAAMAQADSERANQSGESALAEEVARLRAEVEALKAELRTMQASARAPAAAPVGNAAAAPAPAPAAAPAPVAPQLARAEPEPVRIRFKGAPEISTSDGWSFKPRGRIQIDGGYLAAPGSRASGQSDGRGFTSRIRRAFLGAQGTIPGGFGYRVEFDFAGDATAANDIYLTYDDGPLNITLGQHNNFSSMERLQSDLFLTFLERAAFTQAFNLERRVGISAGYARGMVMVNAGIFTDDVAGLGNDGNKSVSYDGRLVLMPKIGDLQLHLGGSAHYRRLGRFQAGLGQRYRARPALGTTDIRYADTGVLTVDSETHIGTELAANWRRLHVAGEAAWLHANRPGDADPTFFGGYAEVGFFLTPDSRTYKGGTFDRVVPARPLGGGGFGALEINARYDRLDLTDAGIGGGTQDGFGASLIWTPIAYLRFMADYMHLIYDIPSQQPVFSADVIGVRAQVDF